MVLIWSSFFLFFIVFFLVLIFHLLVWNNGLWEFFGFRVWVSPFECGFLSQRLVENYFSSTYFVLLVFFVIFDLEISLFLNIPFQGVLYKNLLFYFIFLTFLAVGFFLEVGKGYVEWSY